MPVFNFYLITRGYYYLQPQEQLFLWLNIVTLKCNCFEICIKLCIPNPHAAYEKIQETFYCPLEAARCTRVSFY